MDRFVYIPKVSFVSLINDLFQREHIPTPTYEYSYQEENKVFYCTVTLRNEIGITQCATGYGKSKREAKESCSHKLFYSNLALSWKKFLFLQRVKSDCDCPNRRALRRGLDLCYLTKIQTYFNVESKTFHVCLPEVNIHITSPTLYNSSYLMHKQLRRYFEKNRCKGLYPANRIMNIIPLNSKEDKTLFGNGILEMYRGYL